MWPHWLGVEPRAVSPEASSVHSMEGMGKRGSCQVKLLRPLTRKNWAHRNKQLPVILQVLKQRPDHLRGKPRQKAEPRGRKQA